MGLFDTAEEAARLPEDDESRPEKTSAGTIWPSGLSCTLTSAFE